MGTKQYSNSLLVLGSGIKGLVSAEERGEWYQTTLKKESLVVQEGRNYNVALFNYTVKIIIICSLGKYLQ